MSEFLRRFAADFARLDGHSLDRLDTLYSADILFRDPLHELRGLPALRGYFAGLYADLRELRFDVQGFDQVRDGEGYLRWTLSYRHPRLGGGAPIRVEGCSHLLWRDKVYRHRDYFDAGALLYEHIPLLGTMIAWLKRRLA
ncbi:nuclear transport factor 2 family protein [Azotobacter beijerinckii]|uniref:SnoaL-like domain-containing protein n=1 Tax=Azotobacter beijerinckii TaxID=170623 RepID=A0A1I4AFL5_9GAMM|nr:nuclear transport factor 2 family protein [Azotobacter beijerinckii]SFA94054.1 SnoaL-like domain-containing protein [Azotobacter beijerinckii]SFK55134.1 SnoaL-like domain-containing protein [Azotobacter beijerinckii]